METPNLKEIEPVGLDPGFGNIKMALAGGERSAASLPAVVGIGDTDLGLLRVGMGSYTRRAVPNRVRADGMTYLTGENVERYTRPVQRMDLKRLSDAPELRALFYDASFRLLGEGIHAITLIVGLPVEIMVNADLAYATLREMRKWMRGTHRCEVNGKPLLLHVDDVRVMAQPAGTYFAWGLDDAGEWARDKADAKAPVAICDIGFNTLDLFAVEGGQVVGRYSGGDSVGMRRAAEVIQHNVKAKHDVQIALHEADALTRERKPTLHTSDGKLDMAAEVKQAVDAAAAHVLQFTEARWGNARQFAHVLFTGGGAETLEDALLDTYPHGVILPDPVMANALGLARYARRVAR